MLFRSHHVAAAREAGQRARGGGSGWLAHRRRRSGASAARRRGAPGGGLWRKSRHLSSRRQRRDLVARLGRGDFFRLGAARASRAADRTNRHGGVAEPGAAAALFGARLWQAGARVRPSPAAVAGVGRALPRRAPPRKGLTATAMAERAPGVVSRAPQGAAQRAAVLAEDQ